MKYLTEELHDQGFREYGRDTCVVFLKTHEEFGGLSNMAAGYPLIVNDVPIRTAEALYQACRFPDHPDVQFQIVQQASPMAAKMVGKPYRSLTRPDWDRVRTKIMRWCLRVKLLQNWERFSQLLLSTNDSPIVEQSRKDDYWGAKAVDDDTLVGRNVLGRLLMELREEIRGRTQPWEQLPPPEIPNFRLFGHAVCPIQASQEKTMQAVAEPASPPYVPTAVQAQLWNSSSKTDTKLLPNALTSEPYLTHNDSRAAWQGEIPAYWETVPLKRIAGINPSKSEIPANLPEDAEAVFLPMERVASNGQYDASLIRPIADLRNGYTYFRRGDVIVAKITPCFENGKGASLASLPTEFGFGSTEFTVLRPSRRILADFLYLLTIQPSFREEGEQHMTGAAGQQRVRDDFIQQFRVPLPPLDEQAAIVKYLAHVDRKIDRFIRSKRRMIELLNEQKQAIIHQAVTKGLDPSVPMKDSGVEWLGEIPAHWELRRFKHIAEISSGQVDPRDEGYRHWPLIAPNHIEPGTGRLLALESADEQGASSGKYVVRKGQLLYSKIRPYLRKSAVAPVDCLCSADMYAITPDQQTVRTEFLKIVMLSLPFTRFAIDCSLRARMPKVNREALGVGWVWIPSVPEQDEILESLNNILEPMAKSIERAERQIELIREFRSTMVSDVVTGKIDVRAAASSLSDIEEPEPMEVWIDGFEMNGHEEGIEFENEE